MQNGQGPYIAKISKMMDRGEKRLLIDLNDLRNFSQDLTRRYLHIVERITRICSEVFTH